MPAELKDTLEAAAVENKRSLTSEIVARLQASFQDPSTVAWTRAFPHAAAAAAGVQAFEEARSATITKQIQGAQMRDRVSALRATLMGLDTQAVSLQRELLTLQNQVEDADARKDGRTVALLLKQRQQLTALLHQRDVQAKAVKAALAVATADLVKFEEVAEGLQSAFGGGPNEPKPKP